MMSDHHEGQQRAGVTRGGAGWRGARACQRCEAARVFCVPAARSTQKLVIGMVEGVKSAGKHEQRVIAIHIGIAT